MRPASEAFYNLLEAEKRFVAFLSRTYVDSILAELPPERLHISTPVESVSSISGAGEGSASAVKLKVVTGEEFQFDHVLLACHGDQALEILEKGRGGATPDEKDILSKFKTSTNTAVLHSDNDVSLSRPDHFCKVRFVASERSPS